MGRFKGHSLFKMGKWIQCLMWEYTKEECVVQVPRTTVVKGIVKALSESSLRVNLQDKGGQQLGIGQKKHAEF